jgi:hypothetical protein
MRKRARGELFVNSTSGRVKEITKLYHSLNFAWARPYFDRILIRGSFKDRMLRDKIGDKPVAEIKEKLDALRAEQLSSD